MAVRQLAGVVGIVLRRSGVKVSMRCSMRCLFSCFRRFITLLIPFRLIVTLWSRCLLFLLRMQSSAQRKRASHVGARVQRVVLCQPILDWAPGRKSLYNLLRLN